MTEPVEFFITDGSFHFYGVVTSNSMVNFHNQSNSVQNT